MNTTPPAPICQSDDDHVVPPPPLPTLPADEELHCRIMQVGITDRRLKNRPELFGALRLHRGKGRIPVSMLNACCGDAMVVFMNEISRPGNDHWLPFRPKLEGLELAQMTKSMITLHPNKSIMMPWPALMFAMQQLSNPDALLHWKDLAHFVTTVQD